MNNKGCELRLHWKLNPFTDDSSDHLSPTCDKWQQLACFETRHNLRFSQYFPKKSSLQWQANVTIRLKQCLLCKHVEDKQKSVPTTAINIFNQFYLRLSDTHVICNCASAHSEHRPILYLLSKYQLMPFVYALYKAVKLWRLHCGIYSCALARWIIIIKLDYCNS